MKWDAFNRLRAVLDDQGTTVVLYVYDAGNRRVRKDFQAGGSGRTDTDFFYGGWRVLEERTSVNETLTRQFVWGNYLDEALVMDVNGDNDEYCTSFTLQQNPDARYYYLQNTLYSVYALTDDSAAVIEAYEYDPYGRHTLLTDGDYDGIVNFDETDDRALLGDGNGESDLGNPLTFTGQRYDGTYGAGGTGLHHFKNRPYDCSHGAPPMPANLAHLSRVRPVSRNSFRLSEPRRSFARLLEFRLSCPFHRDPALLARRSLPRRSALRRS